MTAAHTAHDHIYQACVDYMVAYESGTVTDADVERLRCGLPSDGAANGIIRDLLVAINEHAARTGWCDRGARGRAYVYLAECGK